MSEVHTFDEAMAFGYLKEGLSSVAADQNKEVTDLYEAWTSGGDYEGSCYLLEVFIPECESILVNCNMDTITKLYNFYGVTLPTALLNDMPVELEAIKKVIVECAIQDGFTFSTSGE